MNTDLALVENNKGIYYLQHQNVPMAEAMFHNALSYDTDCLPAILNLTNLYVETMKPYQAKCWANLANTIKQDDVMHFALVDLIHKISGCFRKKELFEESKSVYILAEEIALRLAQQFPEKIESQRVLGLVYRATARFEEAIQCNKKSIEMGDILHAKYNMANNLREIGLYQQSLSVFSEIEKELPACISDKAMTLFYDNQVDQAIEIYNEIIKTNNSADIRMNRALFLLCNRQWQEGWKEYNNARFDIYVDYPRLTPLWQGEDLTNKTILIRSEQGYGDLFQFIRYVNLLGGNKILQVQPACINLMKHTFEDNPSVVQIISWTDAFPSFDYFCPLLNLPAYFNDGAPVTMPDYIKTDPDLVEGWKKRLPSGNKIGVCWKGGNLHVNDFARSIPFELFSKLFDVDNCTFISLQKDEPPHEKLTQYDLPQWQNTAALIKNLDLVISCDTSICHLAGGLGVECWTLLPFAREWRWGRNTDTTDWYPKMKLITQNIPCDWNEVIDRTKSLL